MGLLDRVKQNQTVPPAGPSGNGPAATATLPGAASYTPPAQVAQPAAQTAPPPASRTAGGELTPAFTAAKVQIHARLIEKFADEIDSSNKAGVREKIVELAEEYFRTTAMTMTKNDKERLVESVLDDVLGLGPLEALLADPNITEIMANHPKQIYVEKSGEPILSSVTFESACQRGHSAHRAQGPGADDPEVLQGEVGPGGHREPFPLLEPRDHDVPAFVRAGPVERPGVRWHRLRQDDAAEHPLLVHP